MNENVKCAIIACIVALPVFAGIGWVADIITVTAVKAVVIANGADPALAPSTVIDRQTVVIMFAIWLLASAITIGMASIGLGPRLPKYPEPPDWAREGD